MRSARVLSLILFIVGLLLNEWAFRLLSSSAPVDAFVRLLVLVLDGFLLVLILTFAWSDVTVGQRLVHLLDHHPRRSLFFLGAFAAYAVCVAVEMGCRYYFKHGYVAPYAEKTVWRPAPVVPDTVLGTAWLRDTVIDHTYMVNDTLVYQQQYRIDAWGRRVGPSAWPDSSYTDFAMVTGCSFAFGYGLAYDQTLGYYLDSISGFRAYNYAVPGHGTQQTLALLQTRDLDREMTEPNGILVHLFIDDHIFRLIGSRRMMKLWARDFPYYRLMDGKPQRIGTFLSGRPWLTRFYLTVSQSAFIDLFDIEIPLRVRKAHLELFGAVLEQAEKQFKVRYPNGRFIVIIDPNAQLAPRVVKELQKRGIEVLDLSGTLDRNDRKYRIHWTESHPNGRYYLELARRLNTYLKH